MANGLRHASGPVLTNPSVTFIENDTFVALLPEPFVVQNKMVGLPPTICKYHSKEQNFKASICYSKNLQIFLIPQFTDQ